jgi:hypothetical protein
MTGQRQPKVATATIAEKYSRKKFYHFGKVFKKRAEIIRLHVSKNPGSRMISGFFCGKILAFPKVLPRPADTYAVSNRACMQCRTPVTSMAGAHAGSPGTLPEATS